jgi:L-ascorbate metabolism protein UlaG (beta-lactamase superfamily)
MGGTVDLGFASVRLTPAWHTSTTPNGTVSIPTGLVVEMGGKRLYHLGDTALFSDLALPARRGHLDLAIVPIGGHYTMDRFDAVVAADLLKADQIIPCHYNTFPPIETDAQAFKADVEQAGYAQVIVLEPGGTHEL